MKPEWHMSPVEDCFEFSVEDAKSKKKYMNIAISKDNIGSLLQGKHLEISFLNDDYDLAGMIDVHLSKSETKFKVSKEVNDLMISSR